MRKLNIYQFITFYKILQYYKKIILLTGLLHRLNYVDKLFNFGLNLLNVLRPRILIIFSNKKNRYRSLVIALLLSNLKFIILLL